MTESPVHTNGDVERDDLKTHTERDEDLEDLAISSSDSDPNEPQLDAAMMNELLLVCSNLGVLRFQTEGDAPILMRGENCTEWIFDLQRAIRRDHAKFKLVAKQLGKWKILQKKLLPLLVNHQHNILLVFSILKVLVMLTMKPPRDSTNIALQLKYLRQYKHEFIRCGIIPVMMTTLVDPLSRKGARTDQDYLFMEIVLTLIRNLLAIPNEDPRFVTSTTSVFSHLQEDLICTLHEENVYEMILLFAQDIDSSEYRDWNLLIMEMICLTLECSQPKWVVAFVKKKLNGKIGTSSGNQVPALTTNTHTTAELRSKQHAGELLVKLDGEKKVSLVHQSKSRRHSNFGGILKMVGPTGRTTVLSDFSKPVYDQVPQAAKKPISRRRGKKTAAPATDIHEIFGGKGRVTESDERAMRVLQEICDSIVTKSYAQLTNSLKTEFRRGSSKLISTDRLQYFYLVWFLMAYHRLKIQALKLHYKHKLRALQKTTKELQNTSNFSTSPPPAPEKPDYDEKAVLSTLDMFSFNFVLRAIENYATMKNYHGMTVSVQLLAEMMAYLADLTASDDPRFQRIADSLQHKIYYERDFLDRLPVLLKTWSPGNFPKGYVVDVVTLVHLVFKVLDSQGNIKVLSRRKAYLDKKLQKNKRTKRELEDDGDSDGSSTDEEKLERKTQLLMEMQRKEADFDVRKYFSSMVSADTIRMYCSLLAEYREISLKVIHYIHSFFYRTKHFQIYQQEKWTMQPMLYSIHVLLLFNKMLQDTYIQRQSAYKNFLDFMHGVIRDFFALADVNNLLFVEVFLRQTYPSKSCMLIQRCYDPINPMSKSKLEGVALGRDQRIAALNESRRHRIALDHEELMGEAELLFSLEPSDFHLSSLVDKESKEDENETEFVADNLALNPSETVTPAQSPKKTPMSRAATERVKNWSKVEDRYLAKVYMKFRHLPSVYEVISYEDMFQERDRTPDQIERRVKYLKLHHKTHSSCDEDDNAQIGGHIGDLKMKTVRESRLEKNLASLGTVTSRRRLRRGADLSDEDGEDEILRGQGGATANPPKLVSTTIGQTTESVVGAFNAAFDEKKNCTSMNRSKTDPVDEIQFLNTPDTQILADNSNLNGQMKRLSEAKRIPTLNGASNKSCKKAEDKEITAEMEAVKINGSQKDVVVEEAAHVQSRKRGRGSEGDELTNNTQAKRGNQEKSQASDTDAISNQPLWL